MGYKPIEDYNFMSAPKDIRIEKLTKGVIAQFHQGKYDTSKGMYAIVINGQVLCYHQQYTNQSDLLPTLFRFTKRDAETMVGMFMRLNYPFPYEVCLFEYNGFMGTVNEETRMPYNARFNGWSGDPGVAVMDCSDGEQRLIPTFAIKYSFPTLPNDMTRVEGSGHTQFFGAASKS